MLFMNCYLRELQQTSWHLFSGFQVLLLCLLVVILAVVFSRRKSSDEKGKNWWHCLDFTTRPCFLICFENEWFSECYLVSFKKCNEAIFRLQGYTRSIQRINTTIKMFYSSEFGAPLVTQQCPYYECVTHTFHCPFFLILGDVVEHSAVKSLLVVSWINNTLN